MFVVCTFLKIQPNDSRRSIKPIPNQYSPINLIGGESNQRQTNQKLPDVDFFIPTSSPTEEDDQAFIEAQELN